ncbi:NPCBM/NEW2 domain-containing protein [Nocardia huaxiensis]|nr:NPCBM/NEW2 domain-containing protein [Nocardia huaxiensis]
MYPDQDGPAEKAGKRKYRVQADRGKGLQLGDNGTQINHFHDTDKKHDTGRTVGIVAVVLVLVVAGVAATLWVTRDGESADAAKNLPSLPITGGLPTSTSTVPVSSSTTTTPRAAQPIWYDLTKLRAVIWNNGFNAVDPVRIGASSYPASIIGSYQSSATDQNDKAVWAIGGQCTRFEAWVGKNTDSSGGGTGRFVVIGDDRELFSTEVGPNDPAVEVPVDITGVIRLTLLDTRRLQDATNAWGRPRVLCASSPGPAR